MRKINIKNIAPLWNPSHLQKGAFLFGKQRKEAFAVIKSVSYDQTEIIKAILHLHVPSGRIDCDPTYYSKGNFYKNTGIEPPRYKFDIDVNSREK